MQGAFRGAALSARYSGSGGALRSIVAREGVAGLYRAYFIHQLTWCPFNGLYIAIYDCTKSSLQQNKLAAWDWVSAPLAGIIAAAVTNPMDLVKTRLQIAASNPGIFDYTGSFDAFVKISKREGPAALLDGAFSRVLVLTPRLSIAMLSYEFIKLKL